MMQGYDKIRRSVTLASRVAAALPHTAQVGGLPNACQVPHALQCYSSSHRENHQLLLWPVQRVFFWHPVHALLLVRVVSSTYPRGWCAGLKVQVAVQFYHRMSASDSIRQL